MLPLIDTHCHIDLAGFEPERKDLLEAAWRSGIEAIVIPAIVAKDFDSLQSIAGTDKRLVAGIGLHPLFMTQHCDADFERVTELAKSDAVSAVGECGLDYTRDDSDKSAQKAMFAKHIALAAKCDKPLLIHANKAVEDVVLTLQQHSGARGIVHSFNGSLQQAERLIDLGFALGFGGAVTYPRAKRLRQLVTQLPLQSIVLETDAPFQTGFRHSGQTNQPAWIVEVLETIAELRQQTTAEIAKATTATAAAIFTLEL